MKALLANHWEKLVLVLTIGFLGWSWMEAGDLRKQVDAGIKSYDQAKQAVDAATQAPIEKKPVHKPGIDKLVQNYFSNAASGAYLLPTSPSAGFETLDPIVVQEQKEKTVTLRIKDEELRKRFKNLADKDKISLRIAPEGIVEFRAIGGTQIWIKGLKFGKATLTIKDKALNGANVQIQVNQSLKFYAHCDKKSLTAKPDPENLNKIHLNWSLASFSHTEAGLGGVKGYVLERRVAAEAGSIKGAAWTPVEGANWMAAFPTSFTDTDVKPGMTYQYRLRADLWLKGNIDPDKVFQQDSTWRHGTEENEERGVWQVTERNASEPVEYTWTPAISINRGIEIIGFTGVQDPGPSTAVAKNTTPRVVIRKWYRPKPEEPGRWIASWITLNRLSKKVFRMSEVEAMIKAGTAVEVGKPHKVQLVKGGPRVEIDFGTGVFVHDIHVKAEGEATGPGTLLLHKWIDPAELARFTVEKEVNGKKVRVLNGETWAFYCCDKDGKNRRIYLSQEVYGRELQRRPEKINFGDAKPEPEPEPEPTPEPAPEDGEPADGPEGPGNGGSQN